MLCKRRFSYHKSIYIFSCIISFEFHITVYTIGYIFPAINTYTWNQTSHSKSHPDDILSVSYEDGKWSKPYFDCGGGNIWMLTYTVPFFAFKDNKYFFK